MQTSKLFLKLPAHLVTDDDKVNTAHEMPATMEILDVEP